jgi:hypothetical protein
MARRYGAGVDIRKTSVPPPHSATTLGGDHTFRHIEKKHYQRSEEEQTVVRICRLNIKKTQHSNIIVVFIQQFALNCVQ